MKQSNQKMMPVDPRLLRLRLQRAGSSTNIAKAAKQAEQLAYQLPLENKCKDNTWKDLRASGLLEELALIISTPLPHRPSLADSQWIFASVNALYYAFRVMQVNTHAPVEVGVASRCGRMVSCFADWFDSPPEGCQGLSKARRHLLLFASQLCAPVAAHPERIDQAFLGSIDFESMLSIIVACIFEDTAAELDQPVISSGCQILSIYGKVRGFGNSTTSSTVKKYGARNMAEKCTTIIEFGPASIEKLVQTSALVHCLIFAESFKMEIIVHCGLHLKLMKRWWEAQRATVKKPLTEGLDQTLFFSDLQALIESIPLSSGQAIVIHDLIQQQDLMQVFGLGLVRPDSGLPGILTGEMARGFHEFTAQNCKLLSEDSFKKSRIRRDWLHVLGCLRAIERSANPFSRALRNSSKESEVDMWQAFGSKLGLQESSLLLDQAKAWKADAVGLVGCSFIKCPLYGEDITLRNDPPLRCTRCPLAQYCTPACQKRDWRHGHRDSCLRNPPANEGSEDEPLSSSEG